MLLQPLVLLESRSVELDPASEVTARDRMTSEGLLPVGWYHSHPTFLATPSRKDVENQGAYQVPELIQRV